MTLERKVTSDDENTLFKLDEWRRETGSEFCWSFKRKPKAVIDDGKIVPNPDNMYYSLVWRTRKKAPRLTASGCILSEV